MTFRKALFIFRRDLRLEDNTALIAALKQAQEVIPIFIFTPEQIEHNPYKSTPALTFMIESLMELYEALHKKLFFFYGKPEAIVDECLEKLKIDAVFVNRDYTPYSQQRDKKILLQCKKRDVPFFSFDDALLHPPEEILKSNGTPYVMFTPYYNAALHIPVPHPEKNLGQGYTKKTIPFAKPFSFLSTLLPSCSSVNGGREAGLILLKQTHKEHTHLSPHLKFTTISPREAYKKLPLELKRALHWRDFFTQIAFFFPYVFGRAFYQKYEALPWNKDKKVFQRWCEGSTGFPLVDAAMRQLNETGLMPNRMRMITASFLVKDLHIDWRWGEKYFATRLLDYDPAVNNGNWQWAASTGCDKKAPLRIFNPWLQQKKYDPECTYIKKWIPELAAYAPLHIHLWNIKGTKGKYPLPLVDHKKEAALTRKYFHSLSKNS